MAELQGESALCEVVVVVASLWDELPGYFGEEWPDLVARIAEFASRLHASPPPNERAALVYMLGRRFRGHPSVAPALLAASTPSRGDQVPARAGERSPRPVRWDDALAALDARIGEVLAERHTEVFAPAVLGVGERDVITVRFTRTPLAARIASVAVSVAEPDMTFEVRIHAPDDLIRVEDPGPRTIAATDDDGESAIFHIAGLATGTAEVALDVLYHAVVVATLAVSIPIGDRVVEDSPRIVATIGDRGPRPADVELRILLTHRRSGPALRFVIHCVDGSAGFNFYDAGETPLYEDPREFHQKLRRRLERASGRPGADRELEAIGQDLWNRILPQQVRDAYPALQAACSMQITSDEPWIPWEIVMPSRQESGRTVLDDPWCLRFDLTRWLSGRTAPPGHIRVASMALLDVGSPDAKTAGSESENAELRRLLSRVGVIDRSPRHGDSAEVHGLLDRSVGHIGLWHFSGHGDPQGLRLADDALLRPEHISDLRAEALRRRRPLVVANLCRSALQGWGPGGLDGWPAAFARAGGTPFVGTQWSVSTDIAHLWATHFYLGLIRGESVGAAITSARRICRTRWPDDLSWLAYSVYAHPHTTVTFGPEPLDQ